LYSGSGGRKIMSLRPAPTKIARPYLKTTNNNNNKIQSKGLGAWLKW
jgi:hypothetical protein